MIRTIIVQNKKNFTRYNEFRKQMFLEFAERDSNSILYLFPWLLSVNHPYCPGYIPELDTPFRVFGIDSNRVIKKMEPDFKKLFGIKTKGSLLRPNYSNKVIEGIYTIGSVGTISHTSYSDCDIWVCYNHEEFTDDDRLKLNQKVNLIKDWMDSNLKIPVYFFISDIKSIREGDFGTVDQESSGSTQRNALKEEFYRTFILIEGKIPLWWLCHDCRTGGSLDYIRASEVVTGSDYWDDEIVDLGNVEKVDENEYFGAALWQLHKSLNSPLKSIIKMLLLKMQLDLSADELVCHKFRKFVLNSKESDIKADPIIFTMKSVISYLESRLTGEMLDFIKQCFYLRCEIKPYSKKYRLRKEITAEFLNSFPIEKTDRSRLGTYSKWDFDSQLIFGNRLLKLIFQLYIEISESYSGTVSEVAKEDITIIGRKLQAFYQKKDNKVALLPKPYDRFNLNNLILKYCKSRWSVFTDSDNDKPVFESNDIVYIITLLVWNDLLVSSHIQMEPNPSSVTLQEIIILGRKIKEMFGAGEDQGGNAYSYLRKERLTKMLVVISFESEHLEKNINDICIIYKNSWGELFVRRFNSTNALKIYLGRLGVHENNIEIEYYLQRNCHYYEKIIERTKKILLPVI